jgi:hypothetical protein
LTSGSCRPGWDGPGQAPPGRRCAETPAGPFLAPWRQHRDPRSRSCRSGGPAGWSGVWMDSRRRLAARRSRAASLAFAWRCPREPTGRRDACRATRRRSAWVAAQGAGWVIRSMVSSACATTAHSGPMPRSIPQRPSGWLGRRGAWATIVATEMNSRPPCSRRVIDSTRARPLATSRCSRRVFSLLRSLPTTGKVRCRRSTSRRIASASNRTRPRSRWRALKRGNPTRAPARRPAFDADQAWRAVTRSAIPQA